jgi:hypothetical protein
MYSLIVTLALCIASVLAFVTPVNNDVASPAFATREAPNLNLMENYLTDCTSQVAKSNMAASSVQDLRTYFN